MAIVANQPYPLEFWPLINTRVIEFEAELTFGQEAPVHLFPTAYLLSKISVDDQLGQDGVAVEDNEVVGEGEAEAAEDEADDGARWHAKLPEARLAGRIGLRESWTKTLGPTGFTSARFRRDPVRRSWPGSFLGGWCARRGHRNPLEGRPLNLGPSKMQIS